MPTTYNMGVITLCKNETSCRRWKLDGCRLSTHTHNFEETCHCKRLTVLVRKAYLEDYERYTSSFKMGELTHVQERSGLRRTIHLSADQTGAEGGPGADKSQICSAPGGRVWFHPWVHVKGGLLLTPAQTIFHRVL